MFVILAAVGLIWAIGSFRIVPPYSFQVVFFFGNPRRIITSGLNWVPLGIYYLSDPVYLDIRKTRNNDQEGNAVRLYTKDTGAVDDEWTIRWRPDPRIDDFDGKPTMYTSITFPSLLEDPGHPENSEHDIHGALQESISSMLGDIAGTLAMEDFLNHKEITGLYINAQLRLDKAAHLRKHEATGEIDLELPSEPPCNVPNCNGQPVEEPFNQVVNFVVAPATATEPEKTIEVTKVFKFYMEHQKWIQTLLRWHDIHSELHSPVELRYGIEIIEFSHDVRPPKEIEEARNREEQANAAERINDNIGRGMDLLLSKNVSPDEALHAMHRQYLPDQRNWTSISIDGLSGGGRRGGGAKDIVAGVVAANQITKAVDKKTEQEPTTSDSDPKPDGKGRKKR